MNSQSCDWCDLTLNNERRIEDAQGEQLCRRCVKIKEKRELKNEEQRCDRCQFYLERRKIRRVNSWGLQFCEDCEAEFQSLLKKIEKIGELEEKLERLEKRVEKVGLCDRRRLREVDYR